MATATARSPSGWRLAGRLGWLLAVIIPGSAWGQLGGADSAATTPSRPSWRLLPRVGFSETYTDNVALADQGARHEWITEVSPGVRLESNSASLKAHLDYQYKEVLYGRDSSRSQSHNALSAFGRLEAVDDRLFVDFNGTITRQSVSAFGAQSREDYADNANTAETSTYRLSPHLRGRLGGYADYELRYATTTVRTDSGGNDGHLTEEWSAALGGNTPFAKLAWSVAANTQRVEYGAHRESNADAATARLTFQSELQYRLWGSVGYEANDYASIEKTGHRSRGLGFEWAPGPRTQLAASREWRFFGEADTLTVSHRTPRTVWRLGHTRSVNVTPNQLVTSSLGTIYDLIYAQLASQYPDPLVRAEVADSFFRATGIPRDIQVTTGFLTQRVTVQRRTELSAVLVGLRNTLTLSGSQTYSRALQPGLLGDDFDVYDRVRQTGVSATFAHKLTPDSSLTLTGSRQRTVGDGGASASGILRTVQLGFQTRAGRMLAVSLSARRSESEGTTSNYVENAAAGSLTYTF